MDTRVPDRKKDFLSGAFFFLSLQDLFHKTAHSGGCLVLLLASGVGVGPQSEPGVEVAQHGGHCFHIHTVLQRRGSESMPIPYNKDKTRNPSKIKGFRACPYSFSNKNTLRSRSKGGVEK